jgi:hypothetical protein
MYQQYTANVPPLAPGAENVCDDSSSGGSGRKLVDDSEVVRVSGKLQQGAAEGAAQGRGDVTHSSEMAVGVAKEGGVTPMEQDV